MLFLIDFKTIKKLYLHCPTACELSDIQLVKKLFMVVQWATTVGLPFGLWEISAKLVVKPFI